MFIFEEEFFEHGENDTNWIAKKYEMVIKSRHREEYKLEDTLGHG